MANNTNNVYELITDKRSVPFSSAITGTLSSSGLTVTGVGTLFTSEIQSGGWIVNLSADEVRKVKTVVSDTQLILQEAFTIDLPALSTPVVINKDKANCVEISVIIPTQTSGGVANAFGEINGQVFPSGIPYTLSKSSKPNENKITIDPIIVDATGTQMLVSVLY